MAIPVISIAQMREWEQATWAAGRKEAEVISRVGHIVAVRAKLLTQAGDLILVLAGKGHNGDDARQASRNFSDREINLINVTEPDVALKEFRSQLPLGPALIIDGLFGIGLNRELARDWINLFEEINKSQIPILSIDVPSGLNADSGQPHGAAIQASITLTLGAPKRGLLVATAWPYVGRLELAADIGLVPNSTASDLQWTCREDFVGYPPRRPVAGHKGTFGHVAIFAGSLGYHGAAVLSARAALRARPGLVTLFTCEEVYSPVASQLQAVMVHPFQSGQHVPESTSTVLFGPGLASPDLGDEFRQAMVRIWKELPVPVVADASGLDWLPPCEAAPGMIRVITPHPGEAARLLKSTTDSIQKDRPKAVRELSRLFGGCWVVLKGHQTLVGRRDGEIFFNSSGNPFLAQGGSGDVLAGYLSGLLAQKTLQKNPLLALRHGVWQHGSAADDLAGKRNNWTVEDLVETLGNVAE